MFVFSKTRAKPRLAGGAGGGQRGAYGHFKDIARPMSIFGYCFREQCSIYITRFLYSINAIIDFFSPPSIKGGKEGLRCITAKRHPASELLVPALPIAWFEEKGTAL